MWLQPFRSASRRPRAVLAASWTRYVTEVVRSGPKWPETLLAQQRAETRLARAISGTLRPTSTARGTKRKEMRLKVDVTLGAPGPHRQVGAFFRGVILIGALSKVLRLPLLQESGRLRQNHATRIVQR